jgi:hypothetical protein
MTYRTVVAALAVPLLFAGTAVAAQDVVPKAGILMSGAIKFPREQSMSLETDPRDGTKLKVRMGFDGKCKGGGLQEAWVSTIEAKPTVRARNGRFSANLTGTERDLGGVKGRNGEFTWKLSGRFTTEDAVSATVSGSAEIKVGGKVVSRCKIAAPAAVKLAVRR